MYKIIKPPKTNDMYASAVIIPASHPFNLYRLNQIRPMAKKRKIIPANEIHIFNIDNDIISPQTFLCPLYYIIRRLWAVLKCS